MTEIQKNLVIISKSDLDGGAAIAAYRLFRALKKNIFSWHSEMLVQRSLSNDLNLTSVLKGKSGKYISLLTLALEKLFFMFSEKNRTVRFQFSLGNTGIPIMNYKIVREADIFHLHYVTQGFLSLNTIEKLLQTNKPMVWTLHDMWPFTGGCHYSGECKFYQWGCGNCKFLKSPSPNDLSAALFRKKEKIFQNKNITVVACSKWLAKIAKESLLFKGVKIIDIPNPIDQTEFYSIDKKNAKKELGLKENKIYLLFAAGNIFDERKGIQYLIDALKLLSETPELIKNIELLVMGKSNINLNDYFPVPVNYFGQVSGIENLRRIYNAADSFLLPSVQDNLPNTIMESLACGTPVIAFKTGGVPEMIIHKETGFLAEERSAISLSDGIKWLVENTNTDFQKPCTEYVKNNYSEEIVAGKYANLYQSLINDGQ